MQFERITIDPEQMGGLPCIRGLRIPVTTILGQLAARRTSEEILADFPDLEEADIYAALQFGAAAVQERVAPARRVSLPAWGEPGSRVLPAVVRGWSFRTFAPTGALVKVLGLPSDSLLDVTFEDPIREPIQSTRLNVALGKLVGSGLGEEPAMEGAAGVLSQIEPAAFFHAIDPLLRMRTRNIVRRELGGEGLLPFLIDATVNDLLALRHFGAVGFFDLLVAAETAAAATQCRQEDAATCPAGQAKPPPERPAWAGAVTADDPRFRRFLGGADSLDGLFDGAGPGTAQRLRQAIASAEAVFEQLQGLTLEQEGASILRAGLGSPDGRWLEALGSRYGLMGTDLLTLAEVGLTVGVTRERVRQVQLKTQASLPSSPVYAPAVEQALELLDRTLPCTGEQLAAALSAEGLTSLPLWTADGFRAAVGLTGRTLDIGERNGLIGRPEELAAAAAVKAAARAVSNAHGIASAATVTRRLARRTDNPVPYDMVEARLRANPALHWVDDSWFWADHRPGGNRLVNTSLRILAVISPQTLGDLREGIQRHFAFRVSARAQNPEYADLAAPAAEQLAAFYVGHPSFRTLPDGRIEATAPVGVEMLGEEAQALIAVLRGQPHLAMDRLSLCAACDEIGMNRSTVSVRTTYSEWLKRFGHNVWGLRGADVPREVIAELQANALTASSAVDRTQLGGTTPSGRPWMARRLTPSFLYSGVMGSDWGKPAVADRTLAAHDMVDGEPVGALRFGGYSNWGYIGFLNRHKAKVGDVLRVLADPDNDACYLELGGDELLSEPLDS